MISCGKKARRTGGNRYAIKRSRRHARNAAKIAAWKAEERNLTRPAHTKEKYGL